ncbi:MAG: DNA-binding NarL/FixJ family response regulator [Arenicella sp.]|jgi:DNA-binding NarL/FixJ family response regulator
MNIALIDDHLLILESLKSLIKREIPDFQISTFSTPIAFFTDYETNRYDLVITDIEMPDISGAELIIKIREKNQSQKILVLSMHKNIIMLESLFELNINGFISKVNSTGELMDAIHSIDMGKIYISPEIKGLLNSEADSEKNMLTKREIQIVQHVVKGLSNKEIASEMFLAVNTVKTHRKNILHKLNMSNSIDLVKYALANNIS